MVEFYPFFQEMKTLAFNFILKNKQPEIKYKLCFIPEKNHFINRNISCLSIKKKYVKRIYPLF